MILLLLFFQSFTCGAAENANLSQAPGIKESLQEKIRTQLEQIVLGKLEFYANQYPEINFIILDSAADVAQNMQALTQLIGQDPVPLDYEHPHDLRETLLQVTLARIEYLLAMNAGSSTLFKPGKGAVANRKYMCVVTMNPLDIAKDNRVATHHLLDVSDSEFESISAEDYLDNVSHLQFTLDHEIFHCLDTLYNGAIPMSKLDFWGDYHRRKNESGADAFAIMMNIAASGKVTAYAKTLMRIRGLALLADDPDHYTKSAIDAVLQLGTGRLSQSDVFERFRLATEIRTKISGSYDDYIHYRDACYFATRLLTGEIKEAQLSKEQIDLELVHSLVNDTREIYRNLLHREITPLK